MLGLINKRQINKLKTVAKGGIFLAAVLYFSVCLFAPVFVQAQVDTGLQFAAQTGLPTTDLRLIIANIIRAALGLLGIAAVIIVLYGGWLWMSAGGNEEQISKAKKTLLNGTVGIVIILSAYGIVSFIMNVFGIGGNGVDTSGNYNMNPPGIMNISGSGALGDVIKDHYPTRNQKDVPRNTRIAITFAKPVRMESFTTKPDPEIEKYLLNTNVISISKVVVSSTTVGGFESVKYTGNIEVQASPVFNEQSQANEIYTIVLTPETLLGDGENKIQYLVNISNGLQDKDGNSIFRNAKCRCASYQWYFTCGTLNDNDPPRVISVFPENNTEVTKDAKIQIKFNEAIFPNAQVSFITSTDKTYYQDKTNSNSIVFIKSDNSSLPIGSFRIVNQYRTLEFISSLMCGTNACGLSKYCLPVCDKPESNCSEDGYEVLFKAASTSTDPNKPPFYSSLMNGIMDMAGNALDDGDGKVENNFNINSPFSAGSIQPDNKHWSFQVTSKMDNVSPYINNLSLGPETTYVKADDALTITWSKRMSEYSLQNISIGEFPNPEERCIKLAGEPWKIPSNRCSKETVGYAPSSREIRNSIVLATTTLTEIVHTPFLENFLQYYLPEITSGVEDLFSNCFYPGKGPSSKGVTCNSTNDENCCVGPYCCNGDNERAPGVDFSSTSCRSEIGSY